MLWKVNLIKEWEKAAMLCIWDWQLCRQLVIINFIAKKKGETAVKIKHILFDLDGTLTESGEGIINCVQYALEKLGKKEEHPENLQCFIGPPLKEQFMKYAGLSEEEGEKAELGFDYTAIPYEQQKRKGSCILPGTVYYNRNI